MEPQRGRSPSAGQSNHIRQHTSASPHPPTLASSPYVTGDTLSSASQQTAFPGLNTSGAFGDPSFTQDYTQQAQLGFGPTYTDYEQQQAQLQLQHQQAQSNNVIDHTFLHAQGLSPADTTNSASSAFPSFDFNQTGFDENTALDPSLLSADLDLLPTGSENVGILDPMATAMSSHSPTPPHLFNNDLAGRSSASPSPHASPRFPQAQPNSYGMNRPRQVSESLDPSSALYPQGQGSEWVGMGGYRSHKRTPSDNLSDISSNHASPYMGTIDDMNAHTSPLLNPTSDPSFNNGLGLDHFTLNENQQHQQFASHSPGHSPGHSPYLGPQQQQNLPPYTAENNFGLNPTTNAQFGQPQNGYEMFPGMGTEAFPSLQGGSPIDFGQADHMSPPEINIDFAPPSRVPTTTMEDANSADALQPPVRTASRQRAKSDSNISRSTSPALSNRGRSPSAGGVSLSPYDNTKPPSRSPSPAARGRNVSLNRNRSSSNASDQRGYILDLANPERTPSNGPGDKRGQKHPATFQCTLCPKRFTRAYNLRSHLRTHTDERPFVCTVCGKAFARQHDRKRHEGLHSGEKKFVCKGTLQGGSQWGCGRRFARADALGRHFRSEAGRVCIKPLLDEEAVERQRAYIEEQQQAQVAAGLVAPQPLVNQPQMDMMNNFLPEALLAQYPALRGLDWNAIPQGPPPDEDMSGRNSFDGSRGGSDYNDDFSENDMSGYSDSNMGGMTDMNNMNMGMNQVHTNGMQQQNYFGGNQAGDYLSDFEGR
ncbi:hypothetical protein DOTSEDRAFT_152208 [Dothistroma septosporum NZE10]|uniref:C2H2-type domain-containing protein n=1 Tax=Dothistroma septosporum (strain NZE10 / CBS 128990) TaxID=675120 RepID=N1PLZ4_DOTSN|nr:hypothetical protein DOTSEDRAFT_152208 [Dothistroma septosporum NZE10]